MYLGRGEITKRFGVNCLSVQLEFAAGCEIEPSVPKISTMQRDRANVPAVSPQQYWYRALYLPLVDHLIQELNDRLLNHNDRFLRQYLIPTQLEQFFKVSELKVSVMDSTSTD